MNDKISQETIFNHVNQQFQVGQKNVRHKDYGICEIIRVEPWKGKLFYFIQVEVEGSKMKVFVAGSKLEVISNE